MKLKPILTGLLLSTVAVPDPILTPGAIKSTDLQEICAPGYDKAHRVWRNQKQTFAKYNIPWSQHLNYEDDDFYQICIGGDNANPLNHWPQPKIESFKKNRLEIHICHMACNYYQETGDRDATQFQNMMKDWATTYKIIFNEEP